MVIAHQRRLDELLAHLESGIAIGDPVVDGACRALLATGMTPRAIVSVLGELAQVRPLAHTA